MKKTTINRVFHLMKPYKFLLAISIILAIIIVLSTLYLPVLTGRAVDLLIGVNQVDFKLLSHYVFMMIITIFTTAAATLAMTCINQSVAYHMVTDLRNSLFNKIMKLPLSFLDTTSHGSIINRMINDVDQFSEGILLGFAQFFTSILTIVLTLLILFSINWSVALVVLLVTPLAVIFAGIIAKKSYRHFRNQSKRRADMTSIVNEMIAGISTVKAFTMEEKTKEKFIQTDDALRQASLNSVFYSSVANPVTRFINALVYAGVAAFGSLMVITGKISVGQLTSVLSYATQYAKPFNDISGVITELQNSLACAERVFILLDHADEPREKNHILENVTGEIDIENVDFSYDKNRKLIQNLNLHVKPGQTIAIVGPTGAGKSTIINLLMRFYDVDKGHILVENQDIQDVTRKSLRTSFGMVLQETWLKGATVAENIAFGKPDATMEEIQKAAKEAYADNFIRKLPQGYQTLISEGGENLSAGQRQLLCIARIMLNLPPILILDEATSNIDTMTEARISSAFTKMMQGRTSFIVAHRLSTIRNADVILVLKDGHIIEQGNHQELLRQKGFYYQLVNSK